jgi:hypothetical protein
LRGKRRSVIGNLFLFQGSWRGSTEGAQMIVLSYGMTKSGSTLAFELCKSILQQKGYKQRRLPDGVVVPGHHINFITDLSVDSLRRVMQEVSRSEIIAIKAHTAFDAATRQFIEESIRDGQMKVHLNYRDLREICLSLVDAGVQARDMEKPAFAEIHTLADAAKAVRRQLAICRVWGPLQGAMHLHYNDVAFDTRRVVDQMCADFGLRKFKDKEYEELTHRVFNESFTQKNKGIKDRYKELTQPQQRFLQMHILGFDDYMNRICIERDYSWFQLPQEILSTDDAALRLGITPRWVEKLIGEGVLPATQLKSSAPWQIPVAALETEVVKSATSEIHELRRRRVLQMASGTSVLRAARSNAS